MRDDHHRARKLLQRDQQGVAHLEIQVIGGLIEQQQVGFTRDQDRQRQPRPLAAREAPGGLEHPLAAEAETAEVIAPLLLGPLGDLGAAAPAELRQRRRGGIEMLQLDLREESRHDIRRGRECPGHGGQLSGEHAHERGFTRAVASENTDPVARVDGERDILDHAACAVSGRQTLEREQRAGQFCRRGELPLEARFGLHGRDLAETRQRLQTALHLPGLARLGAEAGDETRDSRRFAFLAGDERTRALALRRVLYLEGAVVARVGAQPAALDEQYPAHDYIEELTVVRYEQQRSRIASQPLLEPEYGIEVEVVGRLIEQQHVRAAHEGAREVRAHFQSAGELPHRPLDLLRRKSESRRELRGAALSGVPREPLVLGMQGTDTHPVRAALRLCQLHFHRPQLQVAVENVLDERRVRVGQLLRDGSQCQIRRSRVLTRIRNQLALDERQQGGLARAVAPDDADLLAAKDAGVRLLDEHLGTPAQADVGECQHG